MAAVAERYLDAQRSFVAMARGLDDADWPTPVACCPGWTVRDVLSHVAGLADDVLAGRLDGAASDPWTAAQVERWRDAAVDELLDQWDAQAPRVAELLEAVGESRPPIDCCSHEHDVRAALGRPGDRGGPVVEFALGGIAAVPVGRPLEIRLTDGRRFRPDGGADPHGGVEPAGGDGPDVLVVDGLDAFELFRSRLGRRSARQVRAYAWSGPVDDATLDRWFLFGPNPLDIVE